jgi:hypothetical protein
MKLNLLNRLIFYRWTEPNRKGCFNFCPVDRFKYSITGSLLVNLYG